MKFTVSTKPLSNAIDLGVINANISKFYKKSGLAQITASKSELHINLEAANICSELILRGSGDEDSTARAFVDCAVLKSIVSTFDADTTTFEFVSGGIALHSGSSNCTLAAVSEGAEDIELAAPAPAADGATSVKVENSDWRFIKEHQLYAAANTFVHPVYTRVWLGSSGDIIVGDFDNSRFTFSKKNKLGKTCLISDTIVNLLDSLPEGAQLTELADGYRIDVKTDGFEYAAQFRPQYETDEGIGSYNADVILSMCNKDEANSITLNIPSISRFLSQADILSSGTSSIINIDYANGELRVSDDNVDGRVKVPGTASAFSIKFPAAFLRTLLSSMDSDDVKITPLIQQDEAGNDITAGLVFYTEELAAVLGGVEE